MPTSMVSTILQWEMFGRRASWLENHKKTAPSDCIPGRAEETRTRTDYRLTLYRFPEVWAKSLVDLLLPFGLQFDD